MRKSPNPTPSVVTILGFSPLVGLFCEGEAMDQGPAASGLPHQRRVVFRGETIQRVRWVFPELQRLSPGIIKTLNKLIDAGVSDIPEPPAACADFRRPVSSIKLGPRRWRRG